MTMDTILIDIPKIAGTIIALMATASICYGICLIIKEG